jgi:hypothetical protein
VYVPGNRSDEVIAKLQGYTFNPLEAFEVKSFIDRSTHDGKDGIKSGPSFVTSTHVTAEQYNRLLAERDFWSAQCMGCPMPHFQYDRPAESEPARELFETGATSIWSQSNQGDTVTLYSCRLCGASVGTSDRETHEVWHAGK